MSDGIVTFEKYELHEVSYKINPGFEGDTNISLTVQSQENTENPDVRRVILSVEISGTTEAKIVIAGIFILSDVFKKNNQIEDLNIIATSILLPYARSILSFITASDGSQPILLPTVDLNTLMSDITNQDNNE